MSTFGGEEGRHTQEHAHSLGMPQIACIKSRSQLLSCLHSSHWFGWPWRGKSLTLRKGASMFILSQWISLNNRCIGCESTCKQTCLQPCCQNAAWKEKTKLHGKGPGRASWGWLPKRQSTTGKKQKDAVQGDNLPYTSRAGATLFHSEFLSSDNTNLEYSKQQIQGIMLSQEQTNKYLNCILYSRGKKKPTHNQAPSCSNPGRGRTL